MNISPSTPYPTKLLVAVSAFTHGATIVDLDGEAARFEVDSWSAEASDIGLCPPREHGLWVWIGSILYTDIDKPVPRFTGAWRRATADEATRYADGQALWFKGEPLWLKGEERA